MAAVIVRLPTMLATLVGSDRDVSVLAGTVGGALEALFLKHPGLRVQVMDEQHRLRPHVTCFHNEVLVRDPMNRAVAEGDVVTVLQAVSGG